MKYAVIKVVKGNFAIVSEHSDLNLAKVKYHDTCKVLWNAQDVIKAQVMIMDEDGGILYGYSETITHEQTPTDSEE